MMGCSKDPVDYPDDFNPFGDGPAYEDLYDRTKNPFYGNSEAEEIEKKYIGRIPAKFTPIPAPRKKLLEALKSAEVEVLSRGTILENDRSVIRSVSDRLAERPAYRSLRRISQREGRDGVRKTGEEWTPQSQRHVADKKDQSDQGSIDSRSNGSIKRRAPRPPKLIRTGSSAQESCSCPQIWSHQQKMPNLSSDEQTRSLSISVDAAQRNESLSKKSSSLHSNGKFSLLPNPPPVPVSALKYTVGLNHKYSHKSQQESLVSAVFFAFAFEGRSKDFLAI